MDVFAPTTTTRIRWEQKRAPLDKKPNACSLLRALALKERAKRNTGTGEKHRGR